MPPWFDAACCRSESREFHEVVWRGRACVTRCEGVGCVWGREVGALLNGWVE